MFDTWPWEADEETLEKREEVLLHDLMGETVKARHRQYKTMVQATVSALEKTGWADGQRVETGEYKAFLRFKGNQARSYHIKHLRRLDVKVEGKWETVWDDGWDDISEWDRDPVASSAKPTGKKYKGII